MGRAERHLAAGFPRGCICRLNRSGSNSLSGLVGAAGGGVGLAVAGKAVAGAVGVGEESMGTSARGGGGFVDRAVAGGAGGVFGVGAESFSTAGLGCSARRGLFVTVRRTQFSSVRNASAWRPRRGASPVGPWALTALIRSGLASS